MDQNDGSVVLTGWSSGDWSTSGFTYGGLADFVAVKLDAEGDEVWRYVCGVCVQTAKCRASVGELHLCENSCALMTCSTGLL